MSNLALSLLLIPFFCFLISCLASNSQSQSQIKAPYLAPANQLSQNEGIAPPPPDSNSQPNGKLINLFLYFISN